MINHIKKTSSPPTSGIVRLGILGIGLMGTSHARSILNGQVPGCELTAVCDQNTEAAAAFPTVPFFPTPPHFFALER